MLLLIILTLVLHLQNHVSKIASVIKQRQHEKTTPYMKANNEKIKSYLQISFRQLFKTTQRIIDKYSKLPEHESPGK